MAVVFAAGCAPASPSRSINLWRQRPRISNSYCKEGTCWGVQLNAPTTGEAIPEDGTPGEAGARAGEAVEEAFPDSAVGAPPSTAAGVGAPHMIEHMFSIVKGFLSHFGGWWVSSNLSNHPKGRVPRVYPWVNVAMAI
jgi:hypothetical protein